MFAASTRFSNYVNSLISGFGRAPTHDELVPHQKGAPLGRAGRRNTEGRRRPAPGKCFFLGYFFSLQKMIRLERCLSVEDWKRHVNILGLVVLEVRRDEDREEQPVGQHSIRFTGTKTGGAL